MTIQDLQAGERFVVLCVRSARETGKRLANMGFTRGTQGWMVRRALFGDPLEIMILGYRVSLRKSEAETVEVLRGPVP